jgi:hypothetical protein
MAAIQMRALLGDRAIISDFPFYTIWSFLRHKGAIRLAEQFCGIHSLMFNCIGNSKVFRKKRTGINRAFLFSRSVLRSRWPQECM